MLNRYAQPKRLDGVMQAVWRIVAALLAVLLVVGALAATPVEAIGANDFCTITDDKLNTHSGNTSVSISLKVRDEHGNTQDITLPTNTWPADKKLEIVPNSDMKISVKGMFKDDAITNGKPSEYDQFNLKWEYPLPFSKESAGDGNKRQDVMDGSEQVGWIELVKGEKGMAAIRLEYYLDYVKNNRKDNSFSFSYSMDLKVTEKLVEELKNHDWKFPGTDDVIKLPEGGDIDVGLGKHKLRPTKSVEYVGDSLTELKWQSQIHADAELVNVVFEDTFGSDLIIDKDSFVLKDNANHEIRPSSVEFTQSEPGRQGHMKLTFAKVPFGYNTITYTGRIREGAQIHGDKYTHGSNTVSWRADNADEGSAHCDLPVRRHDYSYVRKHAGNTLDADGNITWTVDLNAGSHKFDMGNFKFTDSLSHADGKHVYVGDLKVYRVENGQKTLIDTVALDTHAHHFEYQFPHDAGKHQYRLVYHTKPEAPQVGRSVYRNKADLFDQNGHHKGEANGEFVIDAKVDTQLLTKQLNGTAVALEGHTGIYKLDWIVNFNPELLGDLKNQVTDFEFTTDDLTLANGTATTNMWFTKTYLNFTIEEQQPGGEWKTISTTDTGYNGSDKFVIDRVSEPSGYDLPEGVNKPQRNSAGFKLTYRAKPQGKVFDKPLRITYTSLFDGTAEEYRNTASVTFKVSGAEQNQHASANYKHEGGNNYVGKTADPKRPGANNSTTEATWYSAADYRAGKISDERCENGCWVADWTVWGNGVKPEWSIVPADSNKTYYKGDSQLNGLQNLSGVNTITVTDTLPKGWLIDESSVGGYFAAAPVFDENKGDRPAEGLWKFDYDRFDTTNGWDAVRFKSNQWQHFKLTKNQNCQVGNGGKATETVCGTWSEESANGTQTATFIVPNNGTLSRFNDADRTSVTGTVGRQSRAVVVITYRTILPVGDVENLETMKKLEFTNHASMAFDGEPVGEASAKVSAENKLPGMLGKNGVQSGNTVKYSVTVRGKDIPHFFDSDTFTVNDALSGESGKAPYAAFSGNFKVLVGEHDLTETARQTGKFSATVSVGANGWQSAKIVTPTDLSNGTVSTRTHDIIVQYEVKLNGMIGDNRELRNSAQIQGSYPLASSHRASYTVVRESGALQAAGSMRVTKVDDSMNAIAGVGKAVAKFSLCQVNLSLAPNGERPEETCLGGPERQASLKTDANGHIYLAVKPTGGNSSTDSTIPHESKLEQLDYNTLYMLWETEAPKGHELDSTPRYFMLHNEDAGHGVSGCPAWRMIEHVKKYRDKYGIAVTTQTRINVMNPKTPEPEVVLPETGGRGRSLWAAMLATLAVGFGALMAMRVRNDG